MRHSWKGCGAWQRCFLKRSVRVPKFLHITPSLWLRSFTGTFLKWCRKSEMNSRAWSECERVSVSPARRSGWALPLLWSWCCQLCLRQKDYSWNSSSSNSKDRWVFFSNSWDGRDPLSEHKTDARDRLNVTHFSTLQFIIDPVGTEYRNVWWDARHDASCAWQDMRHKKDQHEFESCS